jgi:hypothetical protein
MVLFESDITPSAASTAAAHQAWVFAYSEHLTLLLRHISFMFCNYDFSLILAP